MSQPCFLLSPHTYAAPTHDGVIFLDLKSDQYLGLPLQQACLLSAVVRDWPIAINSTDCSMHGNRDEAVQLARMLVERGLLAEGQDCEVRVDRTPPRANKTLVSTDQIDWAPRGVRLIDVLRFSVAITWASFQLRFRSLERVVNGVANRKRRALDQGSAFRVQQAVQDIEVFRRLRPYAFTATGHCLFHSLALLNFLALCDSFPTWVIGVKSGPFGAHSWVEHEGLVLDTTPEEVCFFTPILAV